MIIVNLSIFFSFSFNKLYMPGCYVAFNLLPSDPFDLLASCIVSLTQRINKYVCMYVCIRNYAKLKVLIDISNVFPRSIFVQEGVS